MGIVSRWYENVWLFFVISNFRVKCTHHDDSKQRFLYWARLSTEFLIPSYHQNTIMHYVENLRLLPENWNVGCYRHQHKIHDR
jgi:hypothetical protein